MTKIKINDLKSVDSGLCETSESFINELESNELKLIWGGGLKPQNYILKVNRR